jgi:hypothetical protein
MAVTVTVMKVLSPQGNSARLNTLLELSRTRGWLARRSHAQKGK